MLTFSVLIFQENTKKNGKSVKWWQNVQARPTVHRPFIIFIGKDHGSSSFMGSRVIIVYIHVTLWILSFIWATWIHCYFNGLCMFMHVSMNILLTNQTPDTGWPWHKVRTCHVTYCGLKKWNGVENGRRGTKNTKYICV